MTSVFKVLPLWYDATPVPQKRKAPYRGFSDLRKGQCGGVRLSDSEVRAIRLAGEWEWPPDLVAKLFHISPAYAPLVMRGETHAHVR